MRKSKVLEKLRAGKIAVGGSCGIGPSNLTPGLAGKLGLDFVWLDMEHRWFSYEDLALMILSAREGGADPMVRIRNVTSTSFYRCFELGAAGVMMPHCKSGADARFAADNSKFAPLGRQGLETASVEADFGTADLREFLAWHNRETFLVVQIEDREAVDAADEIAATPGVDVLFLGFADLAQSYGKPGDFEAPELWAASRRVAAACAKAGNWWGAVTGSSCEKIKKFADLGARFFSPFSDFGAVRQVWTAGLDQIRRFFDTSGLV